LDTKKGINVNNKVGMEIIRKVIEVREFSVKNSPNKKAFLKVGLIKKLIEFKNSKGIKNLPNR
jgi:hypothetical protein